MGMNQAFLSNFVMAVQVIELSQSLLDHVLTELSEGNVCFSSVLLQQSLECCYWIVDFDVPLIHQAVSSTSEFLLVDSSLAVYIHCLEVLPELIVETKVNQHPFESSSRYQTLGQRICALNFLQAWLIGPHNNRFGVKNFRQFKNISESFVDFCNREPVVAVDIEVPEDFFSSLDGLFAGVSGDLLCLFFCACSHSKIYDRGILSVWFKSKMQLLINFSFMAIIKSLFQNLLEDNM